MIYIPIAINNKVASVPCGTYIVADNTDYVLSFTFDAEWNGYPQKTARVLIGSQYSDIDFTGNIVTLPPITSSVASILVGVYSDGIATTTPATVQVFASVLGSTGTEYEPVDPTVLPDAPEVAADDTITITDVSEGARAKATIGQIADAVAPLIPEQAARFEVTYNETPFASILAAYNNNKVVVLTMSDNEIPLHSISSTKAIFVGFNPEGGGTNAENISVTSSNVWSYSVFDYYTTEEVDAAVADLTATDTALAGRIATIEGKEGGWNAKWGPGIIGEIPITALEATTQINIMRGANSVSYTVQTLNDAQKTQARSNIGAGTYSKPGTGITKTDLAQSVRDSLDLADSALQSHQDISGKADKPKYTTLTLATSDWQSSGNAYSCSKTITGLTANSIVWLSYSDTETEFSEAQSANTLTFTVAELPSAAITVNVAYMEGSAL